MVIDLKTGIKLWQIYKFISKLIDENMKNIQDYKDTLEYNYNDIDDDELDALENKQQYTPEDMGVWSRATGYDYLLQNADKLPDNFVDTLRTAVNSYNALRKQFRPKQQPQPQQQPQQQPQPQPQQGVQNADTINPRY